MTIKMEDIAGRRFGMLVATRVHSVGSYGGAKWECHCVCGNSVIVDLRNLVNNSIQSCGCAKRGKDHTGRRFGNLVVVSRAGDYIQSGKKYGAVWNCKCDCGNTVQVPSGRLTSGKKTACSRKCHTEAKHKGTRFGKLTAISIESKEEYPSGAVYRWLCRCDCGNERAFLWGSLSSGERTSCGCDNVEDIEGKKFGTLTAIAWNQDYYGLINWACKCDCGNEVDVQQHKLVRGVVRSCGCDPNEIPLDEKCKLVYIVEAHNRIKIGVSHSFWKRLATLQTWCPVRLRVVRLFKGAWLDEEAALHQALNRFAVKGEWFDTTPEMMDIISGASDANTLAKLLRDKYL